MDNDVVELKWPNSEALYKVLHTSNSAVIYPEAKAFAGALGGGPPSEANFSANREILHISWNPKVHHYPHNRQSTVSVLNQTNAIHALKSFCKIHYNNVPHALPIQSSLIWEP